MIEKKWQLRDFFRMSQSVEPIKIGFGAATKSAAVFCSGWRTKKSFQRHSLILFIRSKGTNLK